MFVGLLHAHTIGVAMKLRHIRNNVELPPLIQNDQYDFNYQQWITFPNDVTLLPGKWCLYIYISSCSHHCIVCHHVHLTTKL